MLRIFHMVVDMVQYKRDAQENAWAGMRVKLLSLASLEMESRIEKVCPAHSDTCTRVQDNLL